MRGKIFCVPFGRQPIFLTPKFLIMKHLDFFKRCGSARLWCLLALVALTANVAKADLIFSESFDYTAGNLYSSESTNGWWKNTGTETDPIQVIDGSLTYAGYESTSVGHSIKLKETQSAQKVYKKFNGDQMVASGSIYYAALINIESATGVTGTNTSYFMAMCAQTKNGLSDGGSGTDVAKLSAIAASEGKYKLAISRANTTLDSTKTEYEFGKTYLVVVKYTIVEGETNDIVSLYVNPTTTTEPANADAIYDKTSGSDVSTTNGGFAALVVRQGATASKKAPILTLDAIRVATAWADLFESGSTPEPSATPTIKPSTTTLAFGSLYQDATSELKFTVSGTDLTADITLASNNDEVVLSKTTIAQADAAAEGGVEVTATLTAATVGAQTATITLSSTGATDVTINASWTAVAVTKVADIAALKAGVGTDPEVLFLYTGEAVITYYEVSGEYSTPTFYVEDATGAVRIYDYFSNTCKVGDKIKDFTVVASSEELYRGLPFSFVSAPTIVSSGNDWTPQVVTLKELQDNHDDYLMELVKVEDVTLDLTETTYKAGNNTISQDGTDGAISLTSDNTLVGTAKPTKADVVGISYFTSGYNIRVRTAADIVAKSSPVTGLCRPAEAGQPLCYTTNGQLHIEGATGEVAIYNLTGICVAKTTVAEQATIALPQGVYAVKVAGSTHKVVVSSK